MSMAIGIDIGGTKIAGGVVTADGEVLATVTKPTPAADPNATINTILAVIAELRSNYEVTAVGLGAPGFIDNSRSKIIFSPNITWHNEPLSQKISSSTQLPVILENDANVAAWGEFKFGAAQNHHTAAVITVGTGIGGGIILEDRLIRGSYGFAGEIGHMNMVAAGRLCGCGANGCWEMYSSGNALVEYARTRAAQTPADASKMLELAGGSPAGITGLIVTKAASEGDRAAQDSFREIGKWLGRGMVNLAAILDPEVFVLAGGVSEAGDLLRVPVAESFKENLVASDYRPSPLILLAKLRNSAGLIGAADLALEAVKKKV
ncbi:ROK family glucokinase [Canibacter sp. lx-72]|uniref:ROK family glucokinase n=1 Tax=Canibacter zhuwentaonis TaxID=2837491 RepID=UPI001BDC82E3|nr:ROK family glucokinase [Canibacter zhuwentaonis]MBT1017995.1 ROK family glucokinase [Canibacter zhuwentaonis]